MPWAYKSPAGTVTDPAGAVVGPLPNILAFPQIWAGGVVGYVNVAALLWRRRCTPIEATIRLMMAAERMLGLFLEAKKLRLRTSLVFKRIKVGFVIEFNYLKKDL